MKLLTYLISSVFTLLIFSAGCQSIANDDQQQLIHEPEYNEPQVQSSFGDLPSTVGRDDFEPPFAGDFPFQVNEYLEQLPYHEPTGTWFMADGAGVFGYTIPNGSMEAGEPFEVGLIHATQESNVMERDVRVQLTPCEKVFSCADPIVHIETFVNVVDDEFIVYKGSIPPQENKLYVLSMEVLHEEEVEDTLISYVYVPEESMNVEIMMHQPSEENIRSFAVTNYGPTFLFITEQYTIEQLVDDTWMVVPFQTSFPEVAIYLKPGGSHGHTIDISTFPKGTYRFLKHVQADLFDLDETIAVPFVIE